MSDEWLWIEYKSQWLTQKKQSQWSGYKEADWRYIKEEWMGQDEGED